MTKIKAKKKAADWAAFSFLKAAQIWSTRPMRYPSRSKEAQSGNTECTAVRIYALLVIVMLRAYIWFFNLKKNQGDNTQFSSEVGLGLFSVILVSSIYNVLVFVNILNYIFSFHLNFSYSFSFCCVCHFY